MAVASFVLLGIGVVGVVAHPRRIPAWLTPVAAALLALAVGATGTHRVRAALDPLVAPIAFLLVAVPLAVLLDDLGVFTAAADLAGRSHRLVGGLWLLAAATVALLNLDAAVVLLTPLYVRVARRTGHDPVALAFQPVLLACLASSLLPVSNLTNLIAAQQRDLGWSDFLVHLGPATVVAVAVGWWCYRRAFSMVPVGVAADGDGSGPAEEPGPQDRDRRALAIGGAVVVFLVVGFSVASLVGVEPWVVGLVVVVALVPLARDVPWRSIPWETALVAGSLAVLATAAASHLPVHDWVRGASAAELARTIGVSALGANVVNNLPAFLVGSHGIGPGAPPSLWALLFGVNVGPTVLVTGSLAGLLWLDAVRRLGLGVDARNFARAGLRVGIPALLAGGAVLVALH